MHERNVIYIHLSKIGFLVRLLAPNMLEFDLAGHSGGVGELFQPAYLVSWFSDRCRKGWTNYLANLAYRSSWSGLQMNYRPCLRLII